MLNYYLFLKIEKADFISKILFLKNLKKKKTINSF